MPLSKVEDLEERNIAGDASLSSSGKQSSLHDVYEGKVENDNFEANGLNQNEYETEEDEEEEEEDADFNPLLKESPSREASSSLSSEVDAFEADVSDTLENASSFPSAGSKAAPPSLVQESLAGETDHGEEVTGQAPSSSAGVCDKGFNTCLLHDNNNGSFNNTYLGDGELKNGGNDNSPCPKLIDEDAIWKRTRARYSLASFTLDELETFLQETDDDDDLQNADEEEYRKFLAAVLLGGEPDSQNLLENENDVDDEDEDNDADFELELEEALESDVDQDIREEIQDKASEGRRPKTRQNRHKTTSHKGSKKFLAQSERPLRPLLPNIPLTQRAPFSSMDGKGFVLNHTSDFVPPLIEGSTNGFTPGQIGQLHCLIYEHVQLLIQIFSLSVLEPGRHHVAAKVEELILELLSIRDQVLARRRLPYPNFCFSPPCVHPSVPDESSTILTAAGWRECDRNGQDLEVSPWVPYVDGPVLSILDVAPLRLAGKYMNDVSNVVKDYRQFQVRAACDSQFEREPLFPFHYFQTSAGSHDHLTRDSSCLASAMPFSSSNSEQVPKRSMASSLVEKAKKQSVAPVPKEIAKLAQIFFPLFNPALYPHKPPPAAVANRVLFTDAEDDLLALGLMECNTDWRAIQQRFLPCKSKHQIFVRQKNRTSSKAPENPIKAVRRLKNSPLTTEEMARIEEGLKIFKLDWMSIWKFIVPYRDPSLLPRQWRIANGTQKLYKSDAATKAKRRLYERERRSSKSAAVPSWHTSSEKEDGGIEKSRERDNTNNEVFSKDVTYVHEAFLADWRPNDTNSAGESHKMAPRKGDSTNLSLPQEGSQVGSLLNNRGFKNSQPSSSTAFVARPYRARRINHACLVKLAPDLPPVNLPPSVRVISQSAFKSYQGQVGRVPVNSGSSSQQPQHFSDSKNKQAMKDKEKDLLMHPLLFEAPDDGRFPHYPRAVASGSTNFVSGSTPQLNLNLMHNQHPSIHPCSSPDRSSEPMQYTSLSSGIHFHPLMQKADVPNYSMVSGQPSTQFVGNLASFECRAAQESNHPALRPIVSHANISSTSARSISPREKTNQLDLDIHLSFPSSRLKPSLKCRAVNEASMDRSSDHLDSLRLGSKNPRKFLDESNHHISASCAPYSRKFDSGVCQSDVPCDEGNSRAVVSSEAQPLPEVIMEQEELSDSEDEIEEDVEFECEEMMDSDTEGSDYEQIVEIPNEDMGKVAEDTLDNQLFAPDKSSVPGCSVFASSGAAKVDNSSRSVCLNLNSCPPPSPFLENEIARDSDTLPRKVSPCSTTTKKGKKPILSLTRLLEIDTDQQELPNQESRSITLGESRKRSCSADSRLSRARSKRTPNGKANMDPASSAPVSPGHFD